MIQTDKRFNLVNLESLKKLLLIGQPWSVATMKSAIKEIEMHRKFNKFKEDYDRYLRFMNERDI